MQNMMRNILESQLFAAVIGALLAFFASWIIDARHSKESVRVCATLLLNDLTYIKDYIGKERGSINIRYSGKWEEWLANCDFLSYEECVFVMQVYNLVYNYNSYYELKGRTGSFNKEDINSYNQLKELLFDNTKGFPNFQKESGEFENLMRILQNKAKKKIKECGCIK